LFSRRTTAIPLSVSQIIVYKDVQNLVAMGIIKLKKEKKGEEGKRIRPIALYDEIVFDFQVKKVFPASHSSVLKTNP